MYFLRIKLNVIIVSEKIKISILLVNSIQVCTRELVMCMCVHVFFNITTRSQLVRSAYNIIRVFTAVKL
jgi:hypothetical protein